MDNNNTNNLKRTTLLNLWQNKQFTGISRLSYNATGYPFITLLKQKTATNLYFSKAATERIKLNSFEKNDDLVQNGFLKDAEVVMTENAKGELRFKLTIPSLESNYSSAASLETMFGQQNSQEFDYELFAKEFKSSVDNVVKVENTATEQK